MKLKQFSDKYEANFMAFDFIIASVLSTTLILVVEFVIGETDFSDFMHGNRQALYGALAGLSASLIGFLVSSVAVILAFGDMPQLRLLRTTGKYEEIFNVYFDTMRWFAILTILSFAALFFDTDETHRPILSYCVFSVSILGAFRLWRCVWILKKLSVIAMGFQKQQDEKRNLRITA